jgi:hypothetical protein
MSAETPRYDKFLRNIQARTDYTKRQIRSAPNVFYVVSPDPTARHDTEAWHVVIEGGKFDRLVGKYTEIDIRDGGKSISYNFHTKWIPPECDDPDNSQIQFDELVRDIFVDWLRYAHKNGMMKYAPMTEEMRFRGQFTVDDREGYEET